MTDTTPMAQSLFGRIAWQPAASPLAPVPLPPGRHALPFAEGREAVLVVPEGLDQAGPVPLLVMFHGAGGEANKVLPHLVRFARARKFLLLAPQSTFPTWDIVIGGHGPDLQHLEMALQQVAVCFRLDPGHLAFAGFSDGASYALSVGLTNGDLVSHVIALSAGFINIFERHGSPRVFLAHGRTDSQLPFDSSARMHARQLLEQGVDLTLLPFDGDHVIVPAVVARAIDFFLDPD